MNKVDIALFGADIAEVSPSISVTTDVLCAIFGHKGLANPRGNPLLVNAIEIGVPEVSARQIGNGDIIFDLHQYGQITWYIDHPRGSGFVTFSPRPE